MDDFIGWKTVSVCAIIAGLIVFATEPNEETYGGWTQKCGQEQKVTFHSVSKHSPTYYTGDKYFTYYDGEERKVVLNVCDMDMWGTGK